MGCLSTVIAFQTILLVGIPLHAQPERTGKALPLPESSPFDVEEAALQGAYDRAWSSPSFTQGAWRSYERLIRAESALYAGLEHEAHAELALLAEDGGNSEFRAQAGLHKGLIELKRGDHAAARLSLNNAIEEYTEGEANGHVVSEALFWIGVSHLIESGRGSYERVAELFDECANEYPGEARADDALYYSGQIAEAREEYDRALDLYLQLLMLYPQSDYRMAASVRKIQLMNLLRRYEDAHLALEEVETLWSWHKREKTEGTQRFSDEVDLELVLLRGEICIGRADHPGAERAYLTLLYTLDGGYRRAGSLGLAETYRVAGMIDSALVYYDAILAEGREDESAEKATFFRGLALTNSGRSSEERLEGRTILSEIAEENTHTMRDHALLALADLAWEEESFDNVYSLASQVIASSESSRLRARAEVIAGTALIALGRPAEATGYFERGRIEMERTPEREMPEGAALEATSLRLEGIARLGSDDPDGAVMLLDRYMATTTDSSDFAEVLWLQARAETAAGRNEESVGRLERLVADYPASKEVEEALYTIGWSRLQKGELKQAESAFARLVKAYPLSRFAAESQIRRGDCFYLNKQFAQAAEIYAEVDRFEADKEELEYAGYQGSMAAWLAGDSSVARENFRLFVEKNPVSEYADDALFMVGLVDFRGGAYEGAITVMRRLLDRYEESRLQARAYYTIADAYYRIGRFDEALAAYSIVTERYPESSYIADAETGIVYARAARQKYSDQAQLGAVQVVGEELGGRPGYEMELRRAEIFLEANRIDDAESEYLLFIEQNPASPNLPAAGLGLAEVDLARRDTAKAIESIRTMLATFEGGNVLPMATLRMSELQTASGDTLGAIKTLGEIRARFPESAALAVSLLREADLLIARGDEQEAHEVLRYGADRLDTVTGFRTRSGGEILSRTASLDLRAGDIESARSRWKILARREDRLGAEGVLKLGASLQNEGKIEEAILLYEEVHPRHRENPTLRARIELALGGALELSGRTEEAKTLYREIEARQKKEDQYGREAAQRLQEMSHEE